MASSHKSEQTMRVYSETGMDDHQQISCTLILKKKHQPYGISQTPIALSLYTPESSSHTAPQMAPYSLLKHTCSGHAPTTVATAH